MKVDAWARIHLFLSIIRAFLEYRADGSKEDIHFRYVSIHVHAASTFLRSEISMLPLDSFRSADHFAPNESSKVKGEPRCGPKRDFGHRNGMFIQSVDDHPWRALQDT